MTRRSLAWIIILLIMVFVIVLISTFAWPTYRSGEMSRLKFDPIGANTAAIGQSWRLEGHSSVGGTLYWQWLSDRGGSIYLEEREYGNDLSARYSFLSEDPEDRYRREFGKLVRKVGAPSGIHADEAAVFCGNVQHSATSDLERCAIWGSWMRYGQYLVVTG